MASVEIQTPEGVMRVRLDRDHFTIGRLSTNDIALPFPHISRHHAELRRNGQTWWVVDTHSTNGLHVGAQRVRESPLAPGAVVMLSPQVTLTLHEETAPGYPQPKPQPQPQFQPQAQPTFQQQPGFSQPPQPSYPQSYSAPSQVPMTEEITPLSELGPRSPYADDESPFYPQMRPRVPSHSLPQPPQPSHAPVASASLERRPQPPLAPPNSGVNGKFDHEQQMAQSLEQRRTAFAPPSPLLHVCQTCGQRTTPDAVYCQNCHHSIASECGRCRLSLLPIQDLCPRCQTPNPFSVRRFQRARE